MPEKPSQSSTAITLQQQPTSLATKPEDKQKQGLLSDYLKKYAVITNRNITPTLLRVYEEALSDMPVGRLKAGLEEWLRDGDHWPWPADIREAGKIL